jgi:hypothetical protein
LVLSEAASSDIVWVDLLAEQWVPEMETYSVSERAEVMAHGLVEWWDDASDVEMAVETERLKAARSIVE